MRVGGLWPSIMSADVPHLSLNYPFLTAMAVPSCVALFVCVSADSVAVCVFWGGGGVSRWIIEFVLYIQDDVGLIMCILLSLVSVTQ